MRYIHAFPVLPASPVRDNDLINKAQIKEQPDQYRTFGTATVIINVLIVDFSGTGAF